jgi:hypothetical protein
VQIDGQVETQGNSIVSGENGLYQFLLDGVPVTVSGADGNGFYSFQLLGPAFTFSSSYNLNFPVTNTKAGNQIHQVNVNLACEEVIDDPDGCFVSALSQAVAIRVYTP